MAIRSSTLLRGERSSCLLPPFTPPALLEETSQQQQTPPALCIAISADESILRVLCERGQSYNAVDALFRTHTSLSLPTYLSLLKASIRSNCLPLATCTCAHITLHGIPLHGFLGDYLVMALAKCGAIDDARCISSGLPHLTVFSWTSIISAYADSGRGLEALEAWQQMQNYRVDPDSFTFLSLFKACIAIPDIEKGRSLHAIALQKGFTSNVFVGNAILNMYGSYGLLSEAENAFAELCYRTTGSWNLLLAATIEHGQWRKALDLHRQMEDDGAEPDSFTFVSLFKACSSIPDLLHGRKLLAYAKRKGLDSNLFVGNTILNMYRKCGAPISEAETAFSGMSDRNLVSWTGMLSAYVDYDEGEKALRLYRQMRKEGVLPDQATFGLVLRACIILLQTDDHGASKGLREGCLLEIGQALHADARRDNIHLDTVTATGFVTMYGKFGRLPNAEHVISTLEHLDIVAWNAMLSAYVEKRQGEKALLLYAHMQKEGISSNDITFMTVLQACGMLGENRESYLNRRPYDIIALEVAQSIHMDIFTRGIETSLPIANTLVSVYGKCSALVEAESVFNATPECDIVSWNAMLSACTVAGQGERALHLYEKMIEACATPDEVTHIGIIQACGETGSLETCRKVHFVVLFSEYDRILAVAVTLMDAYGNLARSMDAQVIFDYILHPNVVPWNACIASHAGEGDCHASLRLLGLMNHSLINPNIVTLTSILSICSHSGLVAEGFRYIEFMRIAYDIPLDRTHFKLMIDLLGRAEDFDRIGFLLDRLPVLMHADPVIWQCVLDASTTAGHLELGKQALDYIFSFQPCQS
ncbi:hypothetical protein GOP47_0011866 [Adiantum capillus-veneris]|uniref:Pentatricopeptide repeat-containing protein n=1 Tax=Adiantum capillus-veneris TaxID=13818 RepID=A0A9D4ZFS8_ADICA|nr:hypothetical protein GOP47_0011866 [Adiantum capillus-veneris]